MGKRRQEKTEWKGVLRNSPHIVDCTRISLPEPGSPSKVRSLICKGLNIDLQWNRLFEPVPGIWRWEAVCMYDHQKGTSTRPLRAISWPGWDSPSSNVVQFSPPVMTADYIEALYRQCYVCENIFSLKHKERCLEDYPWPQKLPQAWSKSGFSWIVPENKTDDWGHNSTSIQTEKDLDLCSSTKPELRSYKATGTQQWTTTNHNTVHWKVICTHPPTHANRIQLPLEKPLD